MFQVPPAELEDVIRSIPGIKDVAVIGVPDGKDGEVPCAYVVVEKDSKTTQYDIHKFVDSQVSFM